MATKLTKRIALLEEKALVAAQPCTALATEESIQSLRDAFAAVKMEWRRRDALPRPEQLRLKREDLDRLQSDRLYMARVRREAGRDDSLRGMQIRIGQSTLRQIEVNLLRNTGFADERLLASLHDNAIGFPASCAASLIAMPEAAAQIIDELVSYKLGPVQPVRGEPPTNDFYVQTAQ